MDRTEHETDCREIGHLLIMIHSGQFTSEEEARLRRLATAGLTYAASRYSREEDMQSEIVFIAADIVGVK